MKDIYKFSNPSIVFKKAKSLFGHNVKIELSTRKDKKFMIYDKAQQKWIHFGQFGYEDYTKHKNEERRRQFQQRNHDWKDQPKYSPAFLSYHLLW